MMSPHPLPSTATTTITTTCTHYSYSFLELANMPTPGFKIKMLLGFQLLMPCVHQYAYINDVMKTEMVHC